MKKSLLLVLFALASVISYGQEVKWMTMKEAIEAQKKNKKPIFIDAYTVWCGPCKLLDRNTFTDSKVIEVLNQRYNPVKFNAEGNEEIQFQGKLFKNPNYQEARKKSRNGIHEFTQFLKVPGYPTMAIIGSNGTVLKSIVGYRTPEQLLAEL